MDDPKSESRPVPADPLENDSGAAFGLEDGGDLGFVQHVRAFKQLNYRYLFPLRTLFDPGLLRKKAVRFVVVFGLLPLVFMWGAFRFQLNYNQVLWLIQIYFCLFWALYFHALIRPPQDVWRRAVGYALFTTAIAVPVLLASQRWPIIRDLYANTKNYSVGARVVGYVFGVGLLEELCKASPLLIFGLRGGRIRGVRDAMFLGLMAGFGFAASEGVSYQTQATILVIQKGWVTSQALVFLDRVMAGPLQHGTWAGVVGWFIGVAARSPGSRWQIISVGIVFMAILHGLFDVFSNSLFGLVLAGVGFVVFMGYLMHADVPDGEPAV